MGNPTIRNGYPMPSESLVQISDRLRRDGNVVGYFQSGPLVLETICVAVAHETEEEVDWHYINKQRGIENHSSGIACVRTTGNVDNVRRRFMSYFPTEVPTWRLDKDDL